jgi:hypothetical protein
LWQEFVEAENARIVVLTRAQSVPLIVVQLLQFEIENAAV